MKRRVWLRACLRCGGDMFETSDAFDRFGPYLSCFQCGCIIESQIRKEVAA